MHRIKLGWLRWKSAFGNLYDREIQLELMEEFYSTAIKQAILCGSKCWTIKKQNIQKMSLIKMRILRRMSDNTLRDQIKSECICKMEEVAPIEDKIREPIEMVWICVMEAFMCNG